MYTLALDVGISSRNIDSNKYLSVENTNINKVGVFPYKGFEILGWEKLGLDRDTVYNVYRSQEELEKAAETFNGIPVLSEHVIDSGTEPQREYRVGSTGSNTFFEYPYLKNNIYIHDFEAVEGIYSGFCEEISPAVFYIPVMEEGEFEGMPYDIRMTEIKANHIALVPRGRLGPDVFVADTALNIEQEKKEGAKVKKTRQFRGINRSFAKDAAMNYDEVLAGYSPDEADIIRDFLDKIEGGEPLKEKLVIEDSLDEPDVDSEPVYNKALVKDEDERERLDVERDDRREEERKEDVLEATKRAVEHIRSLKEAQDLAQEIVGEFDASAFDSAESIYGAVLKNKGFDISKHPRAAYKSMVQMLHQQNPRQAIAQDSLSFGQSNPYEKLIKNDNRTRYA